MYTVNGSLDGLKQGLFYSDMILANDSHLADLFEECKITKVALANLLHHLGRGDNEKGMAKFHEYRESNFITLEMIGYDKYEQEKFYILIHEPKNEGGWNRFFIGISRKGALRGILRPIPGQQGDSDDLTNARDLRCKLGKHYRGPISRLMNDDEGIKVTELGGENLCDLIEQTSLSKPERMKIYKNLIQGLFELHTLGYVHTDLTMNNVVIVRDGENKIVGIKIIDLDRLTRIGDEHLTLTGDRYYTFSPERMFGKDGGLADPKDDIWAAMCVICEIERATPKEDRLLHSSFISKYTQYQERLEEGDLDESELYRCNSLFDGAQLDNLFKNLIFNMAKISSDKRPSAGEIADLLNFLP